MNFTSPVLRLTILTVRLDLEEGKEDVLQFQRPLLRQELRQKMSPQLLQSIQLLALPLTDLVAKIEEELEQNPALVVTAEKATESWEELEKKQIPESREPSSEFEYSENYSESGFGFGPTEDNKRQFIEGALSRSETLQDHLLWQLRVQNLSPEAFTLGERLIQNLNEDGFHLEDPASLVKEPGSLSLIPPLLEIIQSFEPMGCAVKDFHESLAVQIRLRNDLPQEAGAIVRDHFDLLEKKKYQEIARKLKISEQDVMDLLDDIRTLDPFPGRRYSQSSAQYVIPDVQVRMISGELVMKINEEEIPVLGLDPFFESQSEKGMVIDKSARQFISQRVKEAQWFIRSLNHRKETLIRVSQAIVEFQREFFHKGPRALRPLTLKDVAEELDLSEATVSRITGSKYMQTEWGIFELKKFFSNSISGSGSSGSQYSQGGVKEVIKEMIKDHQGPKKLTDKKVSELLKQRGIALAVRTVNKYRKEFEKD